MYKHVSKVLAALLVAGALSIAADARAELLMYEPFDYSGTDLDGKKGTSESGLETTNGWDDNATQPASAWGAAGTVTLSDDDTSLSHFDLLGPVGDRINDAGTGYATRGLSGFSVNVGSDSTYYMSALIKGEAMVQFSSGASGYVRTGFGISDSKFRVGIYSGNDAASATYSGGTYSSTKTYFLVAKLVAVKLYDIGNPLGDDHWYLKVYDSTMSIDRSEPGSFDLTYTNISDVDQTYLALGLFDSVAGQVDEIRVGETWADVTLIPEPSTFVLMAMALLGLLVWRWRK